MEEGWKKHVTVFYNPCHHNDICLIEENKEAVCSPAQYSTEEDWKKLLPFKNSCLLNLVCPTYKDENDFM